jgi:hypothetical protein
MARCDVCGNDYDKSLQVMSGHAIYTFDSFELRSISWRPSARTAAAVSLARRRGARRHLLLCQLRANDRNARGCRSGLNGG